MRIINPVRENLCWMLLLDDPRKLFWDMVFLELWLELALFQAKISNTCPDFSSMT